MSVPGPWVFVVIALAVYRVWRLAAQDDLPPLVWARNRLAGARDDGQGGWAFARPTVAYWLQCPYCSGAWIAAAWWAWWMVEPGVAAGVAVPFALSAAAGLVAHNLG